MQRVGRDNRGMVGRRGTNPRMLFTGVMQDKDKLSFSIILVPRHHCIPSSPPPPVLGHSCVQSTEPTGRAGLQQQLSSY